MKKRAYLLLLPVLLSLLAGCTGVTWEQGLEILEDKEREAAYLKNELIMYEQRADSNFISLTRVTANINKCSNDIAETKSCLDIDYKKGSDASLIFFEQVSFSRNKDTTYTSCCSGYREKFKLKKDDYETLQKIWDEIDIDINTLKSRLIHVKAENDSLVKSIEERKLFESYCAANLYKVVDTDPEKVNEFRKKFENAEKVISGKQEPVSECIKLLSEISSSKCVCLPEFKERFESLKKKIAEG